MLAYGFWPPRFLDYLSFLLFFFGSASTDLIYSDTNKTFVLIGCLLFVMFW